MDINQSPQPPSGIRADHVGALEKICIRFDLTLNDIVAFQKYHIDHSPILRYRKRLLAAAICIPALGATIALAPDIPLEIGVVGALAYAAASIALYRCIEGPFLGWYIRKVVLAGNTKGMLGAHELELDQSHLAERTDVNETRRALSAIERIEETAVYAFVYVSAIQAYIIPKRSVVVGDAERFILRLRELVSLAQGKG